MGDAEAVSLVAQLLHDAQTLAILVDIKRYAVSRKIDFLEPFCNTDHGYHAAQPHVVESLDSGRQLTFAAVNNYELRQGFTLVDKTGVTACEHLPHRSEIIGAFDRLDIEMSVIFFGRFGILEHHTRCDRICALNIGVVKTLYVAWKLRETKIRLHTLKYTVGAGCRVALLYALDFIHPMLARVLLRHLE